ncbi:squalene/phytoene synthase family protein [Chloroflexota bacterium]
MMYSEMLEKVSRTFALSIRYLPEVLRQPVGLSYLLYRVSDCLEDHNDMLSERKIALLEEWNCVLQGNTPPGEFVRNIRDLDPQDPEVYVAQRAPDLMAALDDVPVDLRIPIIERVSESTLGMAHWQKQGPFVATLTEMDDYMHYVAGLVGYLMTDLFSWYSSHFRSRKEELLPISREIGLGLQTVNVIRGLRNDYQRGWVFVPQEMLNSVGIDRDQFFLPEYEDRALDVINKLIDKAEGHLQYGLEYISALPWWDHRVRLACIWPLCFALKTLAVSRNNVEVLRNEVKITRQDVKSIMQQTIFLGWSDHWLQGYTTRLSQSPAG